MWVFFSAPFALSLTERITQEISKLSPLYNFSNDFGITEWMINYQGGFVRRGLPGEFLHSFQGIAYSAPGAPAVILSFLLFLWLGIYTFKRSRGILPGWAILATPLLGFPVYMQYTVVR
jgi:hypothetical protein